MSKKLSAGVILYRIHDEVLQVLIAHMGGPFWAKKDEGGWSIPKGEYGETEEPFIVAQREFAEELGFPVPSDEFIDLGAFKQPSGKVICVWAAEGDLDASRCVSNTFEMVWPRGSGETIEVPEVDRAEWVAAAVAKRKLLKGQVPVVEELVRRLKAERPISEGTPLLVSGQVSDQSQGSLF